MEPLSSTDQIPHIAEKTKSIFLALVLKWIEEWNFDPLEQFWPLLCLGRYFGLR